MRFVSHPGLTSATVSTVVPQAVGVPFNIELSFDLDTLTYNAWVDGTPVVTGAPFNTGRADFPIPHIGLVNAGFEFTSFNPQPTGFDGAMQIDNILVQHTP